ncbi:MAG: prepilin-type N-terminal cleavage/methylation domain-containing protein [Lachnospiraceae bacterium]|nr:prepilin-type N-terminal cleavage/methylation domain-containing protein [Lachnospiraceae bacterium]
MKTGLRDNNKGFSLIELLVVIGILALMLGMFLLSTNVIGRTAARQCSKQLRHELEQVRVASMGKNKVTLWLYKDSATGKIMVQQITTIANIGDGAGTTPVDGEVREVGSARVTLDFVSSVDATRTPLDSDGIYFEFNRSTGAFKKVKYSELGGQIHDEYTIKEIYMTGGGLTEQLTLHGITGKVTED